MSSPFIRLVKIFHEKVIIGTAISENRIHPTLQLESDIQGSFIVTDFLFNEHVNVAFILIKI